MICFHALNLPVFGGDMDGGYGGFGFSVLGVMFLLLASGSVYMIQRDRHHTRMYREYQAFGTVVPATVSFHIFGQVYVGKNRHPMKVPFSIQ